MLRLILRIAINAVALWVAVRIVPNIGFTGDLVGWAIVAIVFGLVNAVVRPIVKLLTFPITLITLGLFTLVINAAMLLLTSWITKILAFEGSSGQRFWAALLAGLVVSIVSMILSRFLPDRE
jgi:putative membrane protein